MYVLFLFGVVLWTDVRSQIVTLNVSEEIETSFLLNKSNRIPTKSYNRLELHHIMITHETRGTMCEYHLLYTFHLCSSHSSTALYLLCKYVHY